MNTVLTDREIQYHKDVKSLQTGFGAWKGALKIFVWTYKWSILSDQCTEMEESNRTGKTRDLFKKIRDTKGTFHAKMGSIKDRSGRDLTEAEDTKMRWQEYTKELYKKYFNDPDSHDAVLLT